MEIVYYPNMFVDSEEKLKSLILFWSGVKTIIPPSQMDYINAYLAGNIKDEVHYPLEKYKEILDLAGKPIIDFLVITNEERKQASDIMLDLICNWNNDTGFYNSLKIGSIDDLFGEWITWYWFLNEKLERPLVELLLEEQLVVELGPDEIVGHQEVGKSYMSIIADVIKKKRGVRLITDDEFSFAAKSGIDLNPLSLEKVEETYQLVSMAIPQIFIKPEIIKKLTWKKIIKIRKDLLPLAKQFYEEVENYTYTINSLAASRDDEMAFEKFCEFCERIAFSFKPFSKETGKILRLATNIEVLGFINGIILPTTKLLIPHTGLGKICDIAAISLMVNKYVLSKKYPLVGFEYIENLNREINIERLKNMVTCLIPKKVNKEYS